jgi:hypothetical protein
MITESFIFTKQDEVEEGGSILFRQPPVSDSGVCDGELPLK